MKNSFLYIAIFFCFASLYSAEPLVKFYLQDGSTKEYKLNEIDSLNVIDKKNNYVMRIHYDDTLIAYYPTEIIGSIKFEKDDIQRDILNVYIFSYPKPYKISSIDSIIFYIDQWQPLTIGSQVWMLKNLNVDHYRNGDSIPEVRDSVYWGLLGTGAWCYYDNSDSIGKIYGKLFNWFAVDDSRGLAPVGWHVPSDSEWKTLEIGLGMTQDEVDKGGEWRGTDEGGKLKETGTSHWSNPNSGATDFSGFSALPGGDRGGSNGSFTSIRYDGFWWSSTEDNTTNPWLRYLDYYHLGIYRSLYYKKFGYSVRCVKDK